MRHERYFGLAADSTWTVDRVDLLRKLWAEGFSASQIAARLGGVTRCAVLGKVHRLCLPSRKTTARMQIAPRRQSRKPRSGGGQPRASRPLLNLMEATIPWGAVTISPYLFATHFAGALTLRSGMCRWPYGNPRKAAAYCGREADGSYCPHHARLSGKSRKPRRTSLYLTRFLANLQAEQLRLNT